MCIFFAGSLLFTKLYGDVSNILQKYPPPKNSLLSTVVIYLGHLKIFQLV